MTALEWHSNAPPLRFPGTTLRLVGIPACGGPTSGTGRVGINVVWIRGEDSDEWSYLVTSFEAAAANDYGPSLVFAQCAVEIFMIPMIEKKFELRAPGKKVKRFTNYYRALHVVLPYLCGEAGADPMPDAVRDALDELRVRRNDIIHDGVKANSVRPEEAMKGLCAVAFGFEYMRYAEPLLFAKANRAQQHQP